MALRISLYSIVVATLASGAAIAGDSFRDLQVAYRCEVVQRLERIYATGDPASERDRFLAITLPDIRGNYVQCIFHDANRKIYCEASSGFWLTKKGGVRTFRQPPATVAALANLGFDTDDSTGNFKIDRETGERPDFNALADFILHALHDGYGARHDVVLKFNAPFAPKTPTSCVPVS
jgi:hypothetical protein